MVVNVGFADSESDLLIDKLESSLKSQSNDTKAATSATTAAESSSNEQPLVAKDVISNPGVIDISTCCEKDLKMVYFAAVRRDAKISSSPLPVKHLKIKCDDVAFYDHMIKFFKWVSV